MTQSSKILYFRQSESSTVRVRNLKDYSYVFITRNQLGKSILKFQHVHREQQLNNAANDLCF